MKVLRGCPICDGDLIVCENHLYLPWEGGVSPRACKCGGMGKNCLCNPGGNFPEHYRVLASTNPGEVTKVH